MQVKLHIEREGTRGLLKLPRAMLNTLGVLPGHTVSVEASRRTYGRVMPGLAKPGEALVDPWLAQNTGANDGDAATVEPIALRPLDSIVFRAFGAGALDSDQIKERFFDMPLACGDRFGLKKNLTVEVSDTSPENAGTMTEGTVVMIDASAQSTLGYEGLGGLDAEIARVHEMIAIPLQRPELFDHLGLSAPRGVLFSGPPGSGKTLLARCVAQQTKAAFFHINAPEIVTKHYGESEAALRKTFAAASKSSPAIIFIDEIDAIAPARATLSGEKQVERRIVAQLLTLMDGLTDRGRIVVMAATNLPDALDPALRRPGRFDREIEFRPPTETAREEILRVHLERTPLSEDVDLKFLAKMSHGYVGADLEALAKEAAIFALNRAVEAAGSEDRVDLNKLSVEQADLLKGLAATSPSVLRGDETEVSRTTWQSIGGLEAAKKTLQDSVILPLQKPELFESFAVGPPKGILLSGPPGTGKTLLAGALAHEAELNFVSVRAPRLLSQYFGEAERAIADLFKRARQSSPTLLFFDEIDGLAPRRSSDSGVSSRMVAQFLVELDGLSANRNLIVLGATNRPTDVDPALLRAGRFDLVIEIPRPDFSARASILDVHLQHRPMASELDLSDLAQKTAGLSGADIAALTNAAAARAVGRAIRGEKPFGISAEDLNIALDHVHETSKLRKSDYVKEGKP